jgi:hypothetical protein
LDTQYCEKLLYSTTSNHIHSCWSLWSFNILTKLYWLKFPFLESECKSPEILLVNGFVFTAHIFLKFNITLFVRKHANLKGKPEASQVDSAFHSKSCWSGCWWPSILGCRLCSDVFFNEKPISKICGKFQAQNFSNYMLTRARTLCNYKLMRT